MTVSKEILRILEAMIKLSPEDQRSIRQLIEDPPQMERAIILSTYEKNYGDDEREFSIVPAKGHKIKPGKRAYTIEFNSDFDEVDNFLLDLFRNKKIQYKRGTERNINVTYYTFVKDLGVR